MKDVREYLIENKRDRKLMELYRLLTRSDLKGNYEDTYVVECLFALLCLDVVSHSKTASTFKPTDYLTLAKELVRVCEIDGDLDIYSFFNWSQALIKYMDESNSSVKDIHKMSTYDLRMNVSKYLDKGDE